MSGGYEDQAWSWYPFMPDDETNKYEQIPHSNLGLKSQESGNLLYFLLRCGSRPYEKGYEVDYLHCIKLWHFRFDELTTWFWCKWFLSRFFTFLIKITKQNKTDSNGLNIVFFMKSMIDWF